MLVLALDTTTRQGSIALTRDGALLATYVGDAAITHGERLPGDLVQVLDAHGVRVSDVDVFAVAAGPGSFTGLRIGIATMQGLALANEKPLVGVSALDAIRQAVSSALSPQPSALSPGDEVAVWMDAQRGQVFSAVYGARDVVEAALVDKPADILRRWAHARTHPRAFAGDGAIAYRDLIRAAIADAVIIEPLPPLAPAIALAAAAHVGEHGASAPDAIRPIYIRRSDAELARDRKADLEVSTTLDRSSADL
jgi:tRNA threonylcarbamoyladenosine biosynthesis protein TsaB